MDNNPTPMTEEAARSVLAESENPAADVAKYEATRIEEVKSWIFDPRPNDDGNYPLGSCRWVVIDEGQVGEVNLSQSTTEVIAELRG